MPLSNTAFSPERGKFRVFPPSRLLVPEACPPWWVAPGNALVSEAVLRFAFSVTFGAIAMNPGAPNIVIPPKAGWRGAPKDLSNAIHAFPQEQAQLAGARFLAVSAAANDVSCKSLEFNTDYFPSAPHNKNSVSSRGWRSAPRDLTPAQALARNNRRFPRFRRGGPLV
jgi:hypothetical protein